MEYTFTSLEELASFFDRRAKGIRTRVAKASPRSQDVMRAEAHAYEQAAFIVRNAVIITEAK